MPTLPTFRSPANPATKDRRVRSSLARPALIAGLLLFAGSFHAFAQQRIIVNPNFVKRFSRSIPPTPLPDFSPAVTPCFPHPPNPGGCLRYLGDAECLTPDGTPVDSGGCMAGWITTDPYDADNRSGDVQDGYIKAPTQVAIGTNVEGLSVPNGAAELNAENAGRLYQRVCLAGGEVIPFSYSLGDPTSTGTSSSQARFGIFIDNTNYPGTPADAPASPSMSVANSTVVSTQTMESQMGNVTAPASGGIYQIGFEAVQPSSGAVGNYIANVSITLKPLVDFVAGPALQIAEGQSGFLLVRVNGTVPSDGILVSLQPGAGTASPSEYTLGTPVAFGSSVVGSASFSPNGAGGYLLLIPQGAYDANILSDSNGTTSTTPSGSVRIPISTTDDTIVEDNKTFSLTIEAPGTNGSSPITQWDLGTTAASCWTSPPLKNPGPAPSQTATVTIVDNDVDLAATKLVDNAAPAAGSNVTYTVTFTNNTAQPTVAPFTAHDAAAPVSDAVPSGLTFTSWTCTASGGASCPGGTVNGTTSGAGAIGGNATLPAGIAAAGGTVTYMITAQVGAAQCSSVQNTATIIAPAPLQEATAADPLFITPAPGGAGNNSASATIAPVCPATLAVAVTDGSSIYTPGSTGTYTVTITNSGLAAATGLSASDSLPSGVTLTATPTCAATGTATCGTIGGSAGGNSFNATGASLATGVGNSLIYMLPVVFAPTMMADPLVNTASASASNAPTPVTGSDSDARSPFTVGISKSTSSTVAQPGGTVSYTVTATNSGSVAAPNTLLSDPVPTGIASQTWMCAGSGGAACPAASGSGALNETIATFPVGGSLTYTIAAVAVASPPASVSNTATITPPAGGTCAGSCSDTAVVSAGPVVSVTKTTPATVVLPSGTLVYTVVVENAGAVPASNTALSDPLPAGIASQMWTCAATGGAVCPAASGSGGLNETIVTLPTGGRVTYTLNAVAASQPPATTTNTATITPPSGGACVGSCSATVTTTAAAMIAVDSPTASFNAAAGQDVTFSFTVASSGNGPADGTRIDDPIPAGLVSFTWTCTAAGGAVCPNASGTGPISETVTTFPAGGSLTYTVTALVASNPPPTITNTVTATPPAGGICAGACTLTMLINVAVASIPTLGTLGLLLLAACLAVAAILFLRR